MNAPTPLRPSAPTPLRLSAPTPLGLLHRRLAAAMGLAALAAFISGAGLETPTPLIAIAALGLALVWAPGPRLQRILDPAWRILALLLTARAVYHVIVIPEDIVIPMVDLLLLLLISENLKETGTAGDTRVYSLSFALLVAACAYRPGVVFAISFVTYTALATVTLMVGHLIRKLAQHGARDVRLGRPFLFRIAAMSGVMLALSALVFVAFPRVSRGWVSRGMQPSASVMGFSDRVSLAEHGSRILPNPEVVLRVEFPDGLQDDTKAFYWRGRSYDFFDGVAWDRSPTIPRSAPGPGFYSNSWPGRRVLQRIYATPLDIPVIFGVHPVIDVRPRSGIRALQDNVGDLWYNGGASPTYDVLSAVDRPSSQSLRHPYGPTLAAERHFLQLPNLSPRVKALADSITANAPTQFDKVMAVQSYLHRFRYTLDLPQTAREATLEYFLFRRRAGHCEYFSTAMAILLREVGIPTRNVNGFLGGTWNDFGKFLTVTQNEAHSWIEVFFPGYGWVPFDGTPAAAGDVAREQRSWLGPLRTVFDGVEHRWNKWVLEYNLETQVNLFRRATESFAQRDGRGGLKWNPSVTNAIKLLVVLVMVGIILSSLLRRRRRADAASPEARVYLKLRRRYQRAGFDVAANDPPMRFVKKLQDASAPGSEHAQRAVELYLQSRFGTEELAEAGKRALREAADSARKALG